MTKIKKKKSNSSIKHRRAGEISKYLDEHPLSSLERPAAVREEKQNILIYCEGANTEPSYFNQFRLMSAHIVSFGKGKKTLELVKKALEFRNSGKYDQVWCVFDKDSNSAADFNKAVSLVDEENEKVIMGKTVTFRAAYSIQAFEYWLILHFNDHQGRPMHRKLYNEKINKYINPLDAFYDGNGNKKITSDFFDILEGTDPGQQKSRKELAIDRAKKIYNKLDHRSPGSEESSTTVFQLVEEIIQHI